MVILGDKPNDAAAIALARTALAEPGPAMRFVTCHRPLQTGDAILPVLREARRRRRLLRGTPPLRAPHRRRLQTFTVGTGGQGYGSLEHTAVSPGSDISLLDIGALMVEVRPDRTIAYTYLDKHGTVLDRGTI